MSRNTFVTLGDSRIGRDGYAVVAPAGQTSVYSSDQGIASWAMLQLRKRLVWVAQGGVGGNTVAQMLTRVDDLLSFNPGWLIGFGHVNSTTVTTATGIIQDLNTIFNKCAAKGVNVVWGTDWPGNSAAAPARLISYQVNDWLRSQVGVRPNWWLVDYAAVFVDTATGNLAAGDAADGLHQDSTGAAKLGNELYKVLNVLVPTSDRLISTNDDLTNLIPNGMLEGGATYATSWGQNGTAGQGVASKVARADGFPGFWQQVVVTSGTDYQLRSRITSGTANSWVAGDTVYAECEFQTDSASWNPSEFSFNVNLFGAPGGSITRAADMLHLGGQPASSSRLASGLFRTPNIYIPVGVTTVDVAVILVGSGTYRIARAALKRA
jgi:hypothetical protein